MTEKERAVAACVVAADLDKAFRNGSLITFDGKLRRNKALSIAMTALEICGTENGGGEFMRSLNERSQKTSVPDFETDGTF